MAKYEVHTIVSHIVVRVVEVSDEFPGNPFQEAKLRASLGGGEIIEDHYASGPIRGEVNGSREFWDCLRID